MVPFSILLSKSVVSIIWFNFFIRFVFLIMTYVSPTSLASNATPI